MAASAAASVVWLTLPTAGASTLVSACCGACFAACPAILDSVFLVVTGAFNCAEAGSTAALGENLSTVLPGLGAWTATVAGAGVDARFVEDVLPPDGAAGARETAFGVGAPVLPAVPVGTAWPSCAGAVTGLVGPIPPRVSRKARRTAASAWAVACLRSVAASKAGEARTY